MRAGFEWFVAWRYLRERGRRASPVTLGIGLFFLVAAVALLAISAQMAPPHPADLAAGKTQNWKLILKGAGLGSLVLAQLVGVFGYLYLIQSIFTTISTFGVFLGTWALVIALSVMNGFEVDLRHKILGSNAHVQITKEDGAFTEWREVQERLEGVSGIVAWTPFLTSEVVISANSNFQGVIIKGIDPKTAGQVTDLEKNLQPAGKGRPPPKLERLWPILPDGGVGEYQSADAGPPEPDAGPEEAEEQEDVDAGPEDEEPPPDFSGEPDAGFPGEGDGEEEGEDPPPIFDGTDVGPLGEVKGEHPARRSYDEETAGLDGVIVGAELAKTLHLSVGRPVEVISPIGKLTPQGEVPRVKSFRIAGVFYSGMYEYDTKFTYVTLPALQGFLSLGDEVDGIEIKIRDIDDTGPVVAAVKERIGAAYVVQDWKELNRNLFSALKLEKIAMFLVLTIIILVASFSIISNLIMIVVEKAREIAILKGMGASDGGIMRIFMIEGLYIGLLGTAFGISLGVATCGVMLAFGLPLDPDVYYINRLPVAMDPFAIALVAIAGVAISFVATIYPSYVAARLRPVDGLRYE